MIKIEIIRISISSRDWWLELYWQFCYSVHHLFFFIYWWLIGLKNVVLWNRWRKNDNFFFRQWCPFSIRFLKRFTLLCILCLWLGYQGIYQWSIDLFFCFMLNLERNHKVNFFCLNITYIALWSINSEILKSCHALLLV